MSEVEGGVDCRLMSGKRGGDWMPVEEEESESDNTRFRTLAVVDVEGFSPSVSEEPGRVDAVSLFILSATLGVFNRSPLLRCHQSVDLGTGTLASVRYRFRFCLGLEAIPTRSTL